MASNAASGRSCCSTETSCCLDPSFASFDFASSSSSTSGVFSSASVGLSASDFSPIFEGSTGAATPSSASASSSSLEHSSTPLDRSFSSPDLISSIFEESLAINMHGFDETDGLSQDLDLKGKPCLDDAYPAHVSFQAECGGNDDTLLSSEISDLFLGSSFLHNFSDADEMAAWSNPLISSNPEELQKVPSSTSDEQESASQMFAEWLRSNSHWLSMSDLRKIKLKTSTVENATKRLGGGKKGLMLFLKFVLMWVQNSKQNAVADESAACLSSEGLPTTPPSALMAAAVVNDKQESSGDAFVAAVTPNVLIDTKAQTYPSFPGSESSSTSALNTNRTGSIAQAAQTVAAQSSFPDSELRCYPSMTGGGAYDLQSTSFYPPNSPWLYHASHFMPGVSPSTVSSILPSPTPSSKAHFGGAHNANVGCITTQTQHRQSAGSNLAATCRAARKKRMDMQRWSVRHNRKWAAANQQCHVSAAEMSSGYEHLNAESRSQSRGCGRQNFCISPQIHSPILRSTDLVDHQQSKSRGRHLKLLFHKQLKQSDVGILGRIVLPKAAETCLPPLEHRDGVNLVVEDMNTSEVWDMRYRFWPNNKSRMYLLENTSDFIKLNNLKDGDQMLMYHLSSKRYVIRGIKAKGTQSAAPLGSGSEIHTGDKRTRSFLEEEGETNSSSATIEDELTLEESCMDLSFVDLIEQSLEDVQ